MIQDDKNRWALYLKPRTSERVQYLSRQGGREPFFLHAQTGRWTTIDKVRMELAHKYYVLAETQPDLKSGPVQQRGAGHRPEPDSACVRIQDQTRKELCAWRPSTGRNCSPGASRGNSGSACGWLRTVQNINAIWRPRFLPMCCVKDRRRKRLPERKQGEEDTLQQDKDKHPKQANEESPQNCFILERVAHKKIYRNNCMTNTRKSKRNNRKRSPFQT